MPWEGYLVSFNGSRGRLEQVAQETVYISGDGTVPGELKREGTTIRIYPHFAPAYEVPLQRARGGHGGGDSPLLHDLFDTAPEADRYLRAADQRAGAYSILTGVAANRSMATGTAGEDRRPGAGHRPAGLLRRCPLCRMRCPCRDFSRIYHGDRKSNWISGGWLTADWLTG